MSEEPSGESPQKNLVDTKSTAETEYEFWHGHDANLNLSNISKCYKYISFLVFGERNDTEPLDEWRKVLFEMSRKLNLRRFAEPFYEKHTFNNLDHLIEHYEVLAGPSQLENKGSSWISFEAQHPFPSGYMIGFAEGSNCLLCFMYKPNKKRWRKFFDWLSGTIPLDHFREYASSWIATYIDPSWPFCNFFLTFIQEAEHKSAIESSWHKINTSLVFPFFFHCK